MVDPTDLPLRGVRVLDLSRLLPGPWATLALANLGAAVDKLEEPQGGDPLRQLGGSRPQDRALFAALNRNKRSFCLDLRSGKGQRALQKLLGHYDVLVESFRPSSLSRLGLSPAEVRKAHPRLIHCSLSGFGHTGPDRDTAGHDLTYQARAGVLGLNGEISHPSLPGTQLADVGGGMFAVSGVVAALFARERSGQGRHLDLSLQESALAYLQMPLGARMGAGSQGEPLLRGRGILNGDLPTYGVYRTADQKFLAVGALEPKFAARFFSQLGAPELLEPAFDPARREEVRQEIQRRLEQRTRAEWMEAFAGADACVEPVWEGDELLSDPQLLHRGAFSGGQLRGPLASAGAPARPAPQLGEHTREVLAEAGFSPEEMAELSPSEPSPG